VTHDLPHFLPIDLLLVVLKESVTAIFYTFPIQLMGSSGHLLIKLFVLDISTEKKTCFEFQIVSREPALKSKHFQFIILAWWTK
jgi:hypothetical protein